MDSDVCTAETTSLYIPTNEPTETAEMEHPCAYDDGHDGPHHCMFCGVEWNAEATC